MRGRSISVLLIPALVVVGVLATTGAASDSVVRVQTYQGKTIHWWANRAIAARRQVNYQRQEIAAQKHQIHVDHRVIVTARARLRERFGSDENEYEHAARVAGAVYGVDSEMLIRKGRCESGNWTGFTNSWSGAEGPWQFLPSTWASTPLAAFSPYDPVAAALAAAWMHRVGRGGEWSCQ